MTRLRRSRASWTSSLLGPGALAALAASAFCTGCGETEAAAAPAPDSPAGAEILWDQYGVPHVFAGGDEALFRAFGWAQMHSHGDLLLELYGTARGRAAEYWGESYLQSDRWVWTLGIPERAQSWLEAEEPDFQRKLEAFAAGANAYARAHPGRLADEREVVLPLTAADLLAHQQRITHFAFVAGAAGVTGLEGEPPYEAGSGGSDRSGGSYGWAVAPAHAEGGASLLLANPHLFWGDAFLFYEAQLECPGYRAYGAALVGFPVLGIAFNDELGWTHTVNTHDGADLYELTLDGDGYRWDGATRPFDVVEHKLRVRSRAGWTERPLSVRSSVHGPVISWRGDHALALRVVGLDRPGTLQQWWEMGRARSLAEFETALRRLQLPTFTVIYADRAGHVMHLFGGLTPLRPAPELDWTKPVSGESSATLWTDVHGYDELPRVLDPESGFVQNANEPPWTATLPPPLDRADFPPYLAPGGMTFQAQRSLRALAEDPRISLEELVAYKHSTSVELAERLLDDLLDAAAKRAGEGRDPLLTRARDVLAHWDRRVDAESRGALLFVAFFQRYQESGPVFAVPWDAKRPLETPDGLADPDRALVALEAAARTVESAAGALDAPWGDVFRLRWEGRDLSCSGGMRNLGILRAIEFAPDADGRKRGVSGDGFVLAVELSTPPRARAIALYGNASQPGSPHRADQFELAARRELRPVWRARTEIEAHLERREIVPLQ